MSFTTKTTPKEQEDDEYELNHDEVKKLGALERMKYMFKKYGYVFPFVYFGLYFVFLGAIFALVETGFFFSADDIITLVKKWNLLSESMHDRLEYFNSMGYDWTLNLGAAWIATKFTEPIRLILTLFLTPRAARTYKRFCARQSHKKLLLPLLLLAAQPNNNQNNNQ